MTKRITIPRDLLEDWHIGDPLPAGYREDNFMDQWAFYHTRQADKARMAAYKAQEKPRGRAKNSGKATIKELNSSNLESRRDRWLMKSNRRARLQLRLAMAIRLQKLAREHKMSALVYGHPWERKLWRIFKEFSDVDLTHDSSDSLLEEMVDEVLRMQHAPAEDRQ